jgi:hypothetical protein
MVRDKYEDIKKRHIRLLTSGKKHTISQAIVDKYKWTVDQYKAIEPYIVNNNPNCFKTMNITQKRFTKKEAFDLLEKHVENETTLKNYFSRVNTFLKLMNIDNDIFSDIFIDTHAMIKTITDTYKDPTAYFGFILFILSKSEKLLSIASQHFKINREKDTKDDIFDVLKTKFNYFKNKRTITDLHKRRNDLEYERVYNQIFNIESDISKADYGSTRHLVALMYTHALYDKDNIIHINPRNYFRKVRLITSDEELNDIDNFYNTKTGRLILNEYKTASIYKPYDVIFTPSVQKVINDSIKYKKRSYLIEKDTGGVMARNSLSELVKRIFDGYTIDTIRKSIESYEINVKKTNRDHLAFVSRHTIITQEISYLAQTTTMS